MNFYNQSIRHIVNYKSDIANNDVSSLLTRINLNVLWNTCKITKFSPYLSVMVHFTLKVLRGIVIKLLLLMSKLVQCLSPDSGIEQTWLLDLNFVALGQDFSTSVLLTVWVGWCLVVKTKIVPRHCQMSPVLGPLF